MTKRAMLVGAAGGMAAGMMMAAVEMIYGWVSSVHTAWDAPTGIWASIAGLNHVGQDTARGRSRAACPPALAVRICA